jgi:predicted metal-dependent phosphoesterase TrpH
MKSLKAELHCHSGEDRKHALGYSIYDLISEAHRLKYNVLGITFHNKVFEGEPFLKARRFAQRKGILLIPGCEATIEGKHVLIYNISDKERRQIKTLRDLRKFKIDCQKKKRNIMIIAPHPFFNKGIFGKVFGRFCLGQRLIKNIDIFDAIEYSFMYVKKFNRNKKAVEISDQYCKPLVGNGDVHSLQNLDKTFTKIYSKKNINSIILAIKNGKVELVTKPLSVKQIAKLVFYHSFKT